MTQPANREATYADLFNLPDNQVGEVIGGRLYAHPRPAPKHALAYSALGYSIGGPFGGGIGGPGGWWILDEPEIRLGDDIVVPDIAGWRRERMPKLPETAWFEVAPDWVCEILSPSTAKVDRATKMPIYSRENVQYVWLVDPDARTLEIFTRHEDGNWLLLETLQDDADVQHPPFEAVTFSLANLWE